MIYNAENEAVIRKLWIEGLSATQIAAHFGGMLTRNAVLGKVHRMGVAHLAPSGKPNSSNSMAARQRRATPRVSSVRIPKRPKSSPSQIAFGRLPPTPVPDNDPDPIYREVVVPHDQRRKLIDLPDDNCLWGIGDPRDADFHFCHHTKVRGLPYCMEHSRRAYTPAQPKRPPSAPAETKSVPTERETVDA